MAADASAASTETISVYARIRMNEEGNNEVNLVDGAPDKVRARNLEFNLNRAFSTDAAQEDVYNAVVAPLVQRVLDGYNACILAYGQTGSGKVSAHASLALRRTALHATDALRLALPLRAPCLASRCCRCELWCDCFPSAC